MTHRDALSALATAALLVTACGPKEPPAPPPSATPTAEEAVEEAAEEAVACNYIVLIDAGSTGSRAYTYQIEAAADGGIPTLTELSNAKVEPGLSSFKGEPDKAAGSIAGLLTQADSALDKLPDECEGKTPAALMATAGMRLLEGEEGGEAAANAIYAAVTDAVRDTGLDLRFAGTISGQQEGLYTWLTANYALGNLQGDGPTVGALDLGGASAQIAFAPEGGAGASATLKLGDKTFPVYAHSYLGYGLEQAVKYVADDACFPKGLNKGPNKGKGKFATCVKKLDPVVKPESCAGDSCGLAQPGDTKRVGVAQPKLPAEMSFYASTNFAYTYDFLKPEAATPAALAEAAGGPKGKAGFCGTKWKDIEAAHSDQKPEHLENYCFSAGWITVLLDNLGFADDSAQITWSNQVGDFEAGWALGAALCSVTGCLSG